jgi:hypothetical protein
MTHIPYRGSGPSMAALLANEVQVIFSGPTAAIPQIKAGKVRPLGVTSPKRSGELPDVPTMGEQGYKGFEIRGWYGLMAPAGTPRPVVMRLNEAVNKVLSGGPAAQTLKDRGFDPAQGVVTVVGAAGNIEVNDSSSGDPADLAQTYAGSMPAAGNVGSGGTVGGGQAVLLVPPEHALLFQRGGCSKAQAAALIHARARLPLDWLGEPMRRSLAEQGAALAHGGLPVGATPAGRLTATGVRRFVVLPSPSAP